MINIVIADDHPLLREGIKKIIRPSKDMRIVGEAATLEETLLLVQRHDPGIVVLDLSLPGYDALEGLAKVHAHFPDTPILVLSMHPEERFATNALKTGAAGYLTKAMAAEELLTAIRKIVSGKTYVSPRLAELLASNIRRPLYGTLHANLTERELQVLSMFGAGKQAKQIAAELDISLSSVNTYRARILAKTELTTTPALIRYAIENGLVSK